MRQLSLCTITPEPTASRGSCCNKQSLCTTGKSPHATTSNKESSTAAKTQWRQNKNCIAEHQRIGAFKLWCWRRLLRVPWTAGRSNQWVLTKINTKYSLEALMLKLKLQYFGHLMESTGWKRSWCWERLRAKGEEGGRGWDGQIASLTQWTWANSRRWWRTGKLGVLQSMGSQRVGYDWVTEQQHIYSGTLQDYKTIVFRSWGRQMWLCQSLLAGILFRLKYYELNPGPVFSLRIQKLFNCVRNFNVLICLVGAIIKYYGILKWWEMNKEPSA